MPEATQLQIFEEAQPVAPITIEYYPPDLPTIDQYAQAVYVRLADLHGTPYASVETRRGFVNFIRAISVMYAKQKSGIQVSRKTVATKRGGRHAQREK